MTATLESTTSWTIGPRVAGDGEMPRLPSSVMNLIQIARRHDCEPQMCLTGTRLNLADIERGASIANAEDELTVVRNLVRQLGDRPGLGAEAGIPTGVGALGVWGFALLQCRTVRDAIDVGLRFGYHKFSWELVPASVVLHPGGLRVVHQTTGVAPDIRSFLIEREHAFKLTVVSMLLGHSIPLLVQTTLDRARGGALAARFPEYEFQFGCDQDALLFDESQLDLELPNADVAAAQLCERQCEALVASRPQPEGVAGEIRSALIRRGAARTSLAAIAAERYVAPRTLRRQLAAEGASYRQLVDDVTRTRAEELLTGTDESVDRVATRLGYADAASFTRAFRRWTGLTPGAARARAAGCD